MKIAQRIENIRTADNGPPIEFRATFGDDEIFSAREIITARRGRTRRLIFPEDHDNRSFDPKLSSTSVSQNSVPAAHQCENFAFPPPPPANPKRIGPRRESIFLFNIYFFSVTSISSIIAGTGSELYVT